MLERTAFREAKACDAHLYTHIEMRNSLWPIGHASSADGCWSHLRNGPIRKSKAPSVFLIWKASRDVGYLTDEFAMQCNPLCLGHGSQVRVLVTLLALIFLGSNVAEAEAALNSNARTCALGALNKQFEVLPFVAKIDSPFENDGIALVKRKLP
uniref:Uncharacterized protein n=1 Tax=Trichuris muris TaxID=70415 RepID=A0A5S6R3R4_TRIMR